MKVAAMEPESINISRNAPCGKCYLTVTYASTAYAAFFRAPFLHSTEFEDPSAPPGDKNFRII
ncbi:MAG: hypothetical protein HGA62_02330 [Chlorobiaceae bacterium]|nr:hypothetical protein [Chlorobiaceae bacterium]NTV59786.1 hypothetical protein [Chlorobiaceae bacterium]